MIKHSWNSISTWSNVKSNDWTSFLHAYFLYSAGSKLLWHENELLSEQNTRSGMRVAEVHSPNFAFIPLARKHFTILPSACSVINWNLRFRWSFPRFLTCTLALLLIQMVYSLVWNFEQFGCRKLWFPLSARTSFRMISLHPRGSQRLCRFRNFRFPAFYQSFFITVTSSAFKSSVGADIPRSYPFLAIPNNSLYFGCKPYEWSLDVIISS